MTRLSVVVPTLDEAPTITSFLDSLRAVLGPQDEIIVVDGGSVDGTLALARRAGVDRVLTAERGRAAQMNAGATVAAGDWLWFLHADTTPSLGAVQGLRRAVGRAGARWGYFRVRLDDPGVVFRWIEFGLNLRSVANHTPSGDQGIFVRRELFAEVGGYPRAPFLEDLLLVDLLRRRAQPEPPAGWLVTSARRWRRDGVLATVLRMWALRAAFRLGVSPRRLARHYAGSGATPLPNS